MRSLEVILITVVALVLLVIPTGFAIHCFSCNSHPSYDGEDCWNLTPEMNDSKYLVDCDKVVPLDDYERCRIMLQTVEGDTRVIRSCATWPNHDEPSRCIDRTGTNKIKLRYCECNVDGCNLAPSLRISFVALLAGVASAAFIL